MRTSTEARNNPSTVQGTATDTEMGQQPPHAPQSGSLNPSNTCTVLRTFLASTHLHHRLARLGGDVEGLGNAARADEAPVCGVARPEAVLVRQRGHLQCVRGQRGGEATSLRCQPAGLSITASLSTARLPPTLRPGTKARVCIACRPACPPTSCRNSAMPLRSGHWKPRPCMHGVGWGGGGWV